MYCALPLWASSVFGVVRRLRASTSRSRTTDGVPVPPSHPTLSFCHLRSNPTPEARACMLVTRNRLASPLVNEPEIESSVFLQTISPVTCSLRKGSRRAIAVYSPFVPGTASIRGCIPCTETLESGGYYHSTVTQRLDAGATDVY